MERQVQQALEAAEDPGAAFLWRRICRDLSGDLRVGVATRDPEVARRVITVLSKQIQADWVSLPVEADGLSLGTQDRLLGLHTLLWATPAAAAFGREDREILDQLIEAGAPTSGAVFLADVALLNRLSDNPMTELEEITSRVQTLLPTGWILCGDDSAPPWLANQRIQLSASRKVRQHEVAALLLRDTLGRAKAGREQAQLAPETVQGLLAAEAGTILAARKRGERAAAHLLGAIRRQTEHLMVDLADFLVTLETDLPSQVDAIEDIAVVRRALPHWLQSVVSGWMTDRLAQWRAAVLTDLAELSLDAEDLARAELLVPGLHPALLRGDSDWTTRIGTTAALGGSAALLLFGMWAPALVALSGGIAWNQVRHATRDTANRDKLVASAIT
ncbi:MAG: hypothetical protein GWP91_09565, partial [Rhodobacterales bacterium]|nr:hypothetical protein [Rhodobacterales bacterium]